MKKLVILFLGVFLSVCLYSQNPEENFELLEEQVNELWEEFYQKMADDNYPGAKKHGLEIIELIVKMPQEEQEEYQSAVSNIYYDLSCIYSVEGRIDEAVKNFVKSVELGYRNYAHALEDTDLDNIRSDERFIDLLEQLKEYSDYIGLLKKAGGYEKQETSEYPEFVYEEVENWRIRNVREYLKLDSIAGDGDEISRIMKLMTWVHNTIPHNGNHFPNCELDAVDMYNYSKANNWQGMNCRALAIMLNECYLSMGFKSKFITCLPLDRTDPDCHVINSVYSATLDKWLWMDPSFNAYVMDEKGNLLSIEEVRYRLINDEPLVLNEDANWNNQQPQTKEYYLDYYMAKNLYWFQTPVRSIFNVQTHYRNTAEKYISLVPPGYDMKTNDWNIVVHDAGYFWQKPDFTEE